MDSVSVCNVSFTCKLCSSLDSNISGGTLVYKIWFELRRTTVNCWLPGSCFRLPSFYLSLLSFKHFMLHVICKNKQLQSYMNLDCILILMCGGISSEKTQEGWRKYSSMHGWNNIHTPANLQENPHCITTNTIFIWLYLVGI